MQWGLSFILQMTQLVCVFRNAHSTDGPIVDLSPVLQRALQVSIVIQLTKLVLPIAQPLLTCMVILLLGTA